MITAKLSLSRKEIFSFGMIGWWVFESFSPSISAGIISVTSLFSRKRMIKRVTANNRAMLVIINGTIVRGERGLVSENANIMVMPLPTIAPTYPIKLMIAFAPVRRGFGVTSGIRETKGARNIAIENTSKTTIMKYQTKEFAR